MIETLIPMKRESKIKIGEVYGDWVTKSIPLRLPDKKYRTILVQCKCGNEQIIAVTSLIQGYITKCRSCVKHSIKERRDLDIGTIWGEWVVVGKSFINKNNNQTLIPVQCSCGFKTNINKYSLVTPNQSNCCSSCASFKGVGELAGAYVTALRDGAKKRNLEFNIDTLFLWDLLNEQNYKCALSGVDITVSRNWRKYQFTASLDRINSSKGYIKDNVQWVHKKINKLKSNFPEHELIYWVEKIFLHKK